MIAIGGKSGSSRQYKEGYLVSYIIDCTNLGASQYLRKGTTTINPKIRYGFLLRGSHM